MKVLRSPVETRGELRAASSQGIIGFVPTMGALHEGHLSLVRAARAANKVVVASIFVNPLQFGPHEDFAAYPRNEDDDVKLLGNAGADAIFIPPLGDMYPPDRSTTVSVGGLGDVLEGAHRPGHFDGVCTVVAKLFNIVRPARAYFGQKDAQQVAVLKRMVRDLDFDVEIVVCPIVREPDGLAMSSRNAYLSDGRRGSATVLFRALEAGRRRLLQTGDATAAEAAMEQIFAAEAVIPDYAAARDPDSFGPPNRAGPVLLAVAARIGRARLIDNMLVTPAELEGVDAGASGS
jgi:pantoate--beta-alanine ligase